MYKVLILPSDFELQNDNIKDLFRFVPQTKRERIAKFRNARDRQNTLISEIIVRFEICRTLSIRNEQLQIAYTSYRKPFLEGQPHMHFNISHTHSYIACAFDEQPVGVDIERIQSVNISIADRFFSDDERQYVYHTQQEREKRFLEIWTKKESYLKQIGKGLSVPLNSFSVFQQNKNEGVFFHQIFQNAEAICNLCSKKSFPPELTILAWQPFIESVFLELDNIR